MTKAKIYDEEDAPLAISGTHRLRSKLEQTIGWVLLLVLLACCLIVLSPFVSALLWAVVLCSSSWPVYRRLLGWVGNRRSLAALLMALGMVLILLLPMVIVGATLSDNVKDLSTAARRWIEEGPPQPPAWLAKVPVVGKTATDHWANLASDSANLWTHARRFIEPATSALLKLGLMLGRGLMHLALSVLVAFFFFRDGLSLAERLSAVVDRVAGHQGNHLLLVAGNTIRGVVYGILGTALAQAILAGLGFLVAGVPGAGVLALLTFFVSIIPLLGPALIWIPAAIWLFVHGATGWGIFMVIWGLGVNNIDNVIKPLLISKGSDMPFLLILFGVLGGAIAFGFIGVFLGPTLLAVGYALVEEWSSTRPSSAQSHESSPEESDEAMAI